jgi:hypothetical protein
MSDEAPSAPPAHADPGATPDLLLEFLRVVDASCPRCHYSLRNLSTPICPECGLELRLGVIDRPRNILPFLLTLSPSIFSAIATGLVLGLMVWQGPPPLSVWQPYAAAGFGLASAAWGAVLYSRRSRLIASALLDQVAAAVIIWGVHVGVFILLIVSM